MNVNTTMITAVIAAGTALLSAIVAGVFALVNSQKSRQNEHRLAILKTLLDAAYKEYEFRTKQEIEEAKASGSEPNIKSFTEYIIFYKEFAQLYVKPKMSVQDIAATLESNKKLIDAYYLERERFRPEYHNQSKPGARPHSKLKIID